MTGTWRRLLHRIERQLRREDRPGPATPPGRPSPAPLRTHLHHLLDRRYGYCGACNDYTGAPS
ncbi:hypothetical protein O1L44_29960 [Streptomyces noursei]|nr:hypothetical protein [Streptomyces noursei]